MPQLEQVLAPYAHVDPLGWVAAYAHLPAWAGALAAVAGLVFTFLGGRQLLRLLTGPLGGLIAVAWAAVLAQRLGVGIPARQVTAVAAAVLVVAGLLFPPAIVFLSFGIPTGLVAGQLAGKPDWLLGFVPGLLVGGGIGVALHRFIGAVLSALVGAWMVALGSMAALSSVAAQTVGWLALNPQVVLGAAGALAAGGAVYQLVIRPTPMELRTRALERAQAKARAREQAAMEKRWASHGKKG